MSKKKVLIFIPEFPALTETFIEREVSKLVESENLDVSVFSLKKGKGRMSDLTRQHLKYPRLSVFSFVCGLFFYLSHISKISVAFNTIKNNPNRSFFGSGYLLLKSLGYSYLFSKYKPEIIFAHFMSESSTICLVASIILNVPLVISAHAKDVLQTTGSNISENAELIIEKVSHAKFVFICNKYAYAKVLEVCGKDNLPNVLLRYHGIDYVSLLKEFESVVAPSVSTDLPILFTIGRFVEKKGFTYLVDAVKSLKDSKIDFHLYITVSS